MPGSNPVFGLNTLGGALVLRTRNGRDDPGTELEASGGSFRRRSLQMNHGGVHGDWDHFASLEVEHDDGAREHSGSRVQRGFLRLGHRGAQADTSATLQLADNRLEGGQTLTLSWLDDPRQAYTWPDLTRNRLAALSAQHTQRLRQEGEQIEGQQIGRVQIFEQPQLRSVPARRRERAEHALPERERRRCFGFELAQTERAKARRDWKISGRVGKLPGPAPDQRRAARRRLLRQRAHQGALADARLARDHDHLPVAVTGSIERGQEQRELPLSPIELGGRPVRGGHGSRLLCRDGQPVTGVSFAFLREPGARKFRRLVPCRTPPNARKRDASSP